MITSLQAFFPYEHPPTLLPRLVETNRGRLPADTTFAYWRIGTFHDFCLDKDSVAARDRAAVRAILAKSTALLLDIGHEGPAFHGLFARQPKQAPNERAADCSAAPTVMPCRPLAQWARKAASSSSRGLSAVDE